MEVYTKEVLGERSPEKRDGRTHRVKLCFKVAWVILNYALKNDSPEWHKPGTGVRLGTADTLTGHHSDPSSTKFGGEV